jgi:twinkle protein
VLIGTPGSGKSTLVNQIAVAMGEQHGWVTTFASFEVYPNPAHVNQLRRVHLGRTPYTEADRAAADAWIDQHVSWIVPSRDEPSNFEWIFERLKAGVLRDNASLLVVDPWNQINHASRGGGEDTRGDTLNLSMTDYVGVCLRRLAKLAQDYRAHVLLAVHPAKLMRDRDGKRPMPTGYDAADSAHWVNRPDSGLTIYRRQNAPTKIGCWKCRYEGLIGKLGVKQFSYDGDAAKFFLAEEQDDERHGRRAATKDDWHDRFDD